VRLPDIVARVAENDGLWRPLALRVHPHLKEVRADRAGLPADPVPERGKR